MTERVWAGELRQALATVDRARELVFEALKEASSPLTPSLQHLAGHLDEIRPAVEEAFGRYSSTPSGKLLRGYLLSPEEYYLVCAMAADIGGAPLPTPFGWTGYDVFRMQHVETTTWKGYINVGAEPRHDPGRASCRFGLPPEEIPEASLRPEQRQFFALHWPAVYARFRREPQACDHTYAITRDHARRIAEMFVSAERTTPGAHVADVLRWDEIPWQQPRIYNEPEDLRGSWICYVHDGGVPQLRSSTIVVVSRAGAVTYCGTASDEG